MLLTRVTYECAKSKWREEEWKKIDVIDWSRSEKRDEKVGEEKDKSR